MGQPQSGGEGEKEEPEVRGGEGATEDPFLAASPRRRVPVSPCLRAALVGTLLCLGPSAAGLGAQQEPLDALVAEGLARNPDLRRAEHQLAQADAAVREATGRWLPALTLTARYSERSGNILDIGEMVNPAFRALNQLLGQDAFPTDVSLKQPFKQETGLRLTQPLFQPAVAAGVGMAREGRAAEAAGLVGERQIKKTII